MKKTFLFSLLAISFAASGQTGNSITGTVHGLTAGKIWLAKYYGERLTPVDSTVSDSAGHFRILLSPSASTGLYRMSFGKGQAFDLVLNHENVNFTTNATDPADSIEFTASNENRLYYYYLRIDRMTQQKLELLTPVVDFYPENDHFYPEVISEYEQMQKERDRIYDSLNTLNSSSYAMRIIRLYRTPYLPSSLRKDDRINYLKAHFFDQVDFQDTLLLNSNAWSNKAINYLSLYSNNQLPRKQLEAEFIRAITIMLSAAAINQEVYKFLLDYIVGGFDKYHFDDVLTYIADNFQDPFACEDQARKTNLQKKLDNFKKIAVGREAPDINSPDPKGKNIPMSGIGTEFTLVLFWSSECGHCAEMLPRVKELYEGQKTKKYEVYAVSLDTSRTAWTKFVRDGKFKWINVSDLKGFDSPAANDYNIYATPTMILLDRQKKILAKPVSYRELEEALKENNLLSY